MQKVLILKVVFMLFPFFAVSAAPERVEMNPWLFDCVLVISSRNIIKVITFCC